MTRHKSLSPAAHTFSHKTLSLQCSGVPLGAVPYHGHPKTESNFPFAGNLVPEGKGHIRTETEFPSLCWKWPAKWRGVGGMLALLLLVLYLTG